MNRDKIKIAYTDIRAGNVVINPVIQFINFIMLFYIVVNDYVPIYVFIPLFLAGLVFFLLFVGKQFREIQSPTDLKLQYEKNQEQAKTNRVILEGLNIFTTKDHPLNKMIQERISYLKRIEENEIN